MIRNPSGAFAVTLAVTLAWIATSAMPCAALDLGMALARGVASHPSLVSQREATEAARHAVSPSGAWRSPMLEAGVSNLPTSGGLLIRRVIRGSAAESAGLRGPTRTVIRYNYRLPVGADLITALDGKPVEGVDSLQRAMDRHHGGDILEMTIFRDGASQKLRVKLGEAPQQM